jgi:subtilase family serine protease
VVWSSSSGGISSYYHIPSWQTNVSNLTGRGGSTTNRNIPDVAANADNVYEIYNNNDTAAADDNQGTSAAAPMWAGFMALVNQQLAAQGRPVAGFINPALYAIAAGSNYSACFHDVTSGNNTTRKSPSLFYATNNYDLCTGLGTMNGTNLINALAPPVSAPRLLVPVRKAGGFILTWTTAAGNSYQLEYATNLNTTNWINLAAATNATGASATLTDSPAGPQRFYRVLARP